MTVERYDLEEIEKFRQDFIEMVEKNITYYKLPQPIPANQIKFGDVISFRSCLNKDKPGSSNPYVCFKDNYMRSQNQTMKNTSNQIIYKIGVIKLSDEQWALMNPDLEINPVILEKIVDNPNQTQTKVEKNPLLILIEEGESYKIEFKATLRVDLRTNLTGKHIEFNVLKTLVAFLNSDGGTLLIGVDDKKSIIGLEPDFNSFSKADKLDEFRKHFDNLFSRSIGDRYLSYLKAEFPTFNGKIICVLTIKSKSKEPVFLKNENKEDLFFIRRQASSVELKLVDAIKYISEHWS